MKNKGILCALFGGALWGLSGTCGQFVISSKAMDAFTLGWFRFLVSGFILTIMSLCWHREQIQALLHNKKDCLRCFVFALAGLLLCQMSFLETIQYSNAAISTVFQYSGILLIMIVTCILQKRLPYQKDIIAVGLVLVGVFFVATHGQFNGIVISQKALIWGIIGSFSMMLYSMLPGNLLLKYGTQNILGICMLLNGIIMSFFVHPFSMSYHFSMSVWFSLVLIVLVGTIMAYSLYLTGVALIGAMKASMIACVEPVVATAATALCLHTNFSALDLFGFFCIILGVLIVNYQKSGSVSQ